MKNTKKLWSKVFGQKAYLKCICGWKSKAYPKETMFAGVGGQLSCPICTKLKRNRNIEVYGEVKVVIE